MLESVHFSTHNATSQGRLSFFPLALPDEPTYSVCSAFHALAGTSTSATRRLLFGVDSGSPDLAMNGSYLSRIVQQTGDDSLEACRRWLWEHTMYPIWGAFAADGLNQAWLTQVATGAGNGFGRFGPGDNVPRFRADLALCVQCVNEDLAKHGRARWQRSHQVLGVNQCYRHQTRLVTTCDHCGTSVDHRPKMGLPEVKCLCCGHLHRGERLSPGDAMAERYARLAHRVLNSGQVFDTARLVTHLLRRHTELTELQSVVELTFGPSLVASFKAYFGTPSPDAWLVRCVRRSPRINPLVLLASASVLDIDLPLSHRPDAKPNPSSAPLSTKVGERLDALSLTPASRFGMVRAILRGDSWHSVSVQYSVGLRRLRLLRTDWSSLRERRAQRKVRTLQMRSDLIRELATGGDVSAIMRKHGLAVMDLARLHTAYPELAKTQRLWRRKLLGDLIRRNPNASRRTIEEDETGRLLIQWLRKCDAAWLKANLPRTYRCLPPSVWASRDAALLAIVKSAAYRSTIRSGGGRASFSFPVKDFGKLFLRNLRHGKLPRTLGALAKLGFVLSPADLERAKAA